MTKIEKQPDPKGQHENEYLEVLRKVKRRKPPKPVQHIEPTSQDVVPRDPFISQKKLREDEGMKPKKNQQGIKRKTKGS